MNLLSFLFPKKRRADMPTTVVERADLEARKHETLKELAEERGNMRATLQRVQSGSLELRNMAGTVRILNLTRQIPDEQIRQ